MGILYRHKELVGRTKVEYKGKTYKVKVYYTDKINGIRYAYSDGHKVIVDSTTYAIDDEKTRQFIINHEIGHIVCGHTALLPSIGRIAKGIILMCSMQYNTAAETVRDMNDEYEADAYAYSTDPEGTLHGLKTLYYIDSTDPSNMKAYQEFKQRYQKLGGTETLNPSWYDKKKPGKLADAILELENNILGYTPQETLRKIKEIMDNTEQ